MQLFSHNRLKFQKRHEHKEGAPEVNGVSVVPAETEQVVGETEPGVDGEGDIEELGDGEMEGEHGDGEGEGEVEGDEEDNEDIQNMDKATSPPPQTPH